MMGKQVKLIKNKDNALIGSRTCGSGKVENGREKRERQGGKRERERERERESERIV